VSEKDHLDIIAYTFGDIRESHPGLRDQINRGLMLVLAGTVSSAHGKWDVGPTHYQVVLQSTPLRWVCNCPQGVTFGPVTAEFTGYPGRICKHICGVAIAVGSGVYLTRPARLLEFVSRLHYVGNLPLFRDIGTAGLLIPYSGGSRILYNEGLVLKRGKIESAPIYGIDLNLNEPAYNEWVVKLVGESNDSPKGQG